MRAPPVFEDMMKKLIAPITICLLIVGYYAGIAAYGVLSPLLWWEKALLIIVPLAIAIGMIVMTVQRIKEIRSKEEDDLGKY